MGYILSGEGRDAVTPASLSFQLYIKQPPIPFIENVENIQLPLILAGGEVGSSTARAYEGTPLPIRDYIASACLPVIL